MNADFYDWIKEHTGEDTARLRLKYGKERADEIMQINCRRRFGSKLAKTLADNPRFIFPTELSGEQATSDRLAAFHASLIPEGATVIDLTAGLGIDVMAIAGRAKSVTAVERDVRVAQALESNSVGLGNVTVINDDCRDFVGETDLHFDVAFIDPARRAADGSRTYALSDCDPDVCAMLQDIRRIADKLIIKSSPMLDISHTLGLLPDVSRVIALGTSTECKELDFVVDFGRECEPEIEAVTLTNDGDSAFAFTRIAEAAATARFDSPKEGWFILEPYPAVMKAAPLKLLGQIFNVARIAANTNVWTAPTVPDGWPGRAYRIIEVLPYASKHIKRYAARYPRVSITARNFNMTAEALRAKLNVKDGDRRLFAVSTQNGERLLVTTE